MHDVPHACVSGMNAVIVKCKTLIAAFFSSSSFFFLGGGRGGGVRFCKPKARLKLVFSNHFFFATCSFKVLGVGQN